jgi:hypothetical protein
MFTRALLLQLAFSSAALLGQQVPAASSSRVVEIPVVLQQSVEAGKTPAGTKVQGKFAAATLFDGALIPKNAVASGVVVESESKTGKDRARLAIRMNTVSWNGGWAPLGAYLMPLYYPTTWQAVPNPPDGSPDPDSRATNGAGQSGSPMNRPFPGNSSEASQGGAIPDIPTISNHPVKMRDVTLAPASDGGIGLVSEHANIKLYKLTTYVFAASESAK